MALDEVLVLKGEGNVDVQVGGPGNNWDYLSACAHMSGPTVPRGDTEVRWCQDPERAGGFKISSKIRAAADQITADLMTKLGKVDYLSDLLCPFGLRARYAKCGEREDPANYDPFMLAYCDVDLQEYSYDDLVIADPGNEDEILVTAPWSAAYEYRIKQLNASRVGTAATLGDQPINDIEYCDEWMCEGYCGEKSDGCSLMWGVTDADVSPYAAPNLVKGVKDTTTQAITWSTEPVLGFNGNLESVECAGDRLLVSGNADSAVGYNDHDGDQDEWNVVVLGNAPTASPHALFARTAREIWVGANAGYVYKSVDGGASWTAMHSAEWTAQNCNAVYAYDRDLVYAGFDGGIILKSEDGGTTWDDVSDVATIPGNILVVVVPPSRPREVYVGTNNGRLFRSRDEGASWAQVNFDGDGVGTVDDVEFCGPCAGDVMFILHNDAGPRARILRDLSGGAGGADVEIVMDWLDVIPIGIDLNAMDCCGPNELIAAGENHGGYPVVIKAS